MADKGEILARATDLKKRVEQLHGYLKIDAARTKLKELEKGAAAPDFWNDRKQAEAHLKEQDRVRKLIESFTEAETEAVEIIEFLELVKDEEEAMVDELSIKVETLAGRVSALEFQRMFQHEADPNNAILMINSGAGGTEAQDWVAMLLRMYMRYFDRHDMKATLVDTLAGEEAGYKSATVSIEADYAYGYLKAERGIHRLVRISPFDANKRRHTSFASVFVLPQVSQDIDIEIIDADLRIDTYRASGAGGQHVNKTDSAVRITHLPTGIVVQCQNERSQHKNKAMCMKILKSKLYEKELEEREKKA